MVLTTEIKNRPQGDLSARPQRCGDEMNCIGDHGDGGIVAYRCSMTRETAGGDQRKCQNCDETDDLAGSVFFGKGPHYKQQDDAINFARKPSLAALGHRQIAPKEFGGRESMLKFSALNQQGKQCRP